MRLANIPWQDEDSWVGTRVRYQPRGGDQAPEYGRVIRMASSRTPACFVEYDNSPQPKFTYICDLEKCCD